MCQTFKQDLNISVIVTTKPDMLNYYSYDCLLLGRSKNHCRRKPAGRQPVRPDVPRLQPGREGDRGGLPKLRSCFPRRAGK